MAKDCQSQPHQLPPGDNMEPISNCLRSFRICVFLILCTIANRSILTPYIHISELIMDLHKILRTSRRPTYTIPCFSTPKSASSPLHLLNHKLAETLMYQLVPRPIRMPPTLQKKGHLWMVFF
jgi:hypothetical protein